jgi:hypothetical protein
MLTAAGRWGFALLAIHTILLFFSPIPPIHNGSSVPGYALSLLVVALLAIEIARQAPALVEGWDRAASGRLRATVVGIVLGGLGAALVFRWVEPEAFGRFSREEGLWEPLTVTCFLAGAILLWRAARGGRGSVASRDALRPWRLLAVVYVWLALEEVDYFGIFGGLIGRIQGIYAGSLHDLIRLTAFGVIGAVAWAVLIAVALLVAVISWRTRYLQPRWIAARLADPRAGWALAGLVLLGIAAAADAEVLGWTFAMPSPEEALELAGSAFLAVYALEEAAGPAAA